MRGFEHLTESDVMKFARQSRQITDAPTAKPVKYRNQKCEWQGERFDSKHELEDWLVLRDREARGEIHHLRRQVPMPLYAPLRNSAAGGNVEVAQYVADFVFVERGQLIVQDSKGHRTREYLLKRKWLSLQDGVEIRET